ncbi:hypothetical protein SELMODRAFT_271225 [Selaginella moellendorffii]|uniref:Chalcone synthase n=1 Tax=Selaginella moellendorffii TaxID=88036 RepID=D8S128_SELML|nr:chalcone synthase 6-4 [Selaginella moellendorffii]XP_024537912.1 chalcone synthase 6-4 [Selaginella moellendorffii]EFJ21767.1 hypothetical protein SELMODRAFT_271225 [Selaginella moellendorffii]|eukprot:XP_002977158.1 chalcone synthase 6-4 [Selaginella moellendorffii]
MTIQDFQSSGKATVLAVGTAVPPKEFDQSTYPDFYFNVTNCNDKVELKGKFQRICDRSGIKKRHFYLDEEILKANPGMCTYMGASLDVRQNIAVREVPKLAKEAALKAIKEWGQPKSKITHLVFGTTSGVDMPGADFQLLKLLGLRPNVKRIMLYQQGCSAGATVTRVAKDLAENNPGARVLVACSEVTAVTFRAPSETHLDGLVGAALFGDGAAALIIGSNPTPVEKPLFEVHWSGQCVLPDSDGAILGHLREAGLVFHLLKDVPGIISKNIEKLLAEPLDYVKSVDEASPAYTDLFWVVHPGGPAILDQVEAKLKLDKDRMQATRDVLAQYGNMSSASVLFVLDQMRKRSVELNKDTTGDGLKWGVMLGFGPGLTVEALLLKSI